MWQVRENLSPKLNRVGFAGAENSGGFLPARPLLERLLNIRRIRDLMPYRGTHILEIYAAIHVDRIGRTVLPLDHRLRAQPGGRELGAGDGAVTHFTETGRVVNDTGFGVETYSDGYPPVTVVALDVDAVGGEFGCVTVIDLK